LKFVNNPDPTHNFLSTPTTKSAVPVETGHVSIGMQSRPHPSTDESINDERASPTHEAATDFARCNVCLVDV